MSKYIVFSDLHLHNWGDFATTDNDTGNSRLTNQISALEDILSVARSEGRTVLFLGDLFHQRGRVATNVFNSAMDVFDSYKDVEVIAIEGNHDNVTNSINSISSLEPLTLLPNFKLVQSHSYFEWNGDSIMAVSYGDEYEELKNEIKGHRATLLLGHLGVEGSMGAGKSKLDGAFSVGDLCSDNYGLVLLGHYHKRQFLNDNSLYVGNPISQDFGDDGQDKGYFTFETSDGKVVEDSLKYTPLNYPRFIKITTDNVDEYEDLDELSKNNYVRLIVPEKVLEDRSIDTTDLSPNIRVEKQIETVSESRLDIDSSTDTISIVKTWAKEFQPENEDVIIKQIQKVL